MNPSLPANTLLFCRSACSRSITATICFAKPSYTPQRCTMICCSSLPGRSSTCISRKRLRKARDSTLRPPYLPGGFCVANSMKLGCGRTTVFVSGINSSRLSSSSRFSASSTSDGAKFSSSKITQ